VTDAREKELIALARAIDKEMEPLRKLPMSDRLVELNTERGKILNELYGQVYQ